MAKAKKRVAKKKSKARSRKTHNNQTVKKGTFSLFKKKGS